MTSLQIRPVSIQEPAQLETLCRLAEEIWNQHYFQLLGPAQISYMLKQFQSPSAISRQVTEERYQYYFLEWDGQPVGYMAVQPKSSSLFLSKLYLRQEARGKGIARSALAFLEEFCRERGLSSIWLTVNKHNTSSIAVYQKLGFVTVKEQVADIGNGYVMDDYVMEIQVSP